MQEMRQNRHQLEEIVLVYHYLILNINIEKKKTKKNKKNKKNMNIKRNV